jgi:tetratricopeptide (TPR) repeat protein
MPTSPPRVFVSFAHESDEHDRKIMALVDALRGHGIDAICYLQKDWYDEGFILWMEKEIKTATWILMVCTELYRRRSEGEESKGKGLGVVWESRIIRNLLHQSGETNHKFIPIVLEAAHRKYVPTRFYDFPLYTIVKPHFDDPDYLMMYRVLTDQEVPLAPLGGIVRVAGLRVRPWNVPTRNPFFAGREAVLDQMRSELLRTGKAALIGLGGVGKTQTAIQFGYRYRGDYKAIFWTRAESSAAFAMQAPEIARMLDLPSQDEIGESLVEAIQKWLNENDGWLLILDNADRPEAIKALLPQNDNGHILVTSRSQVLDVLGIANPIELREMSPAEAIAFLFRRTGREQKDGIELAAARELAAAVGYLPLALEQACAYIHALKASFSEYLKSFKKRHLELLNRRRPVAGDYPESVRTTWALNFTEVRQHSNAAADLLYLLAFLTPDNIPLEFLNEGAAELGTVLKASLCDVDEDPLALDAVLEPLIRYSLVRRDMESRCISVHRLVQAVLRSEMTLEEQALYAERMVRGVIAVFPSAQFENRARCRRLIDLARTAADMIESRAMKMEGAQQLLYRAGAFLRQEGQPRESEELIHQAIDVARDQAPGEHAHVAISLSGLGFALRDQGKYKEAAEKFEEALHVARTSPEVPDKQGIIAQCMNNLGDTLRLTGEYAKAEPLLRQGLAIRSEVYGSQHQETARSLHDLGVLYYDQGWHAEAARLIERALETRRSVLSDNDPDLARNLDSMGRVYTSLGRYTEAEPLFQSALKIAEEAFKGQARLALIIGNYADLLEKIGRAHEAQELRSRGEAIRSVAAARGDVRQ